MTSSAAVGSALRFSVAKSRLNPEASARREAHAGSGTMNSRP